MAFVIMIIWNVFVVVLVVLAYKLGVRVGIVKTQSKLRKG